MTYATLQSPVGILKIWAQDDGIASLEWRLRVLNDLNDEPPAPSKALEIAQEAIAQLADYFAGVRQGFDLPIAPRGTKFQQKFSQALCDIQFGDTRSYGDLAKDLGVSAQAIGQACGANPIAIIVPCHRVLGAAGLGGFSGAGGVEAKVWLLKHEGAASLLI